MCPWLYIVNTVEKETCLLCGYTCKKSKNTNRKALGLLPPGLEPETFASLNIQIEVLVRRSNQLSYGSRPIRWYKPLNFVTMFGRPEQ